MKPYSLNDEVPVPKRLTREQTLRIREIVRETADPKAAANSIYQYASMNPDFLTARLDGSDIEVIVGDTIYRFHHKRTVQKAALSV